MSDRPPAAPAANFKASPNAAPAAQEALSVSSEILEKLPTHAEGGNSSDDSAIQAKVNWSFQGISTQIANLVGIAKSKKKNQPLPSVSQQKILVEKKLKAEQSRLLRLAEKTQNMRRFSAENLEKIIQQVRYLQSLIDRLIDAAKSEIESLYSKYVLKTA